LREFRTYGKCLIESFDEGFRKDFDFILLSIASVMNNLTIQYNFGIGDDETYRRGELILDMQTQCCKKCEHKILEIVLDENYESLPQKIVGSSQLYLILLLTSTKEDMYHPQQL
jgi:hypothetical protein